VREVRVNRLEAETFYAEVVVRGSDGEKTIDSRPSDALALALQFDTSIFVASQVLSAVEEARSTRPEQPVPSTSIGAADIVKGIIERWPYEPKPVR
jgi:bifunctional DNase/RNase